MIKIDLHIHTGEDPRDGLRYPATTVIDRAAELGFEAIAITLHRQVLDDERLFDYARQRGVLLIRGAEWRIGHRDVLLYNLSQHDAQRIRGFDDLAALRRERGEELLVIAPHPYHFRHSLHGSLEKHMELFDAIECSCLHFPWLDLNRKARHLAAQRGKPLVATSDTHSLWMFGRRYTWVEAEPTVPSVFGAIRQGRTQPVSPPMSLREFWWMIVRDPLLHRNRRGQLVASFPD